MHGMQAQIRGTQLIWIAEIHSRFAVIKGQVYMHHYGVIRCAYIYQSTLMVDDILA